MLEKTGDGVADADMTGEERKRWFNYSYLLQDLKKKEKKNRSAKKVKVRPGAGDRKRERG